MASTSLRRTRVAAPTFTFGMRRWVSHLRTAAGVTAMIRAASSTVTSPFVWGAPGPSGGLLKAAQHLHQVVMVANYLLQVGVLK